MQTFKYNILDRAYTQDTGGANVANPTLPNFCVGHGQPGSHYRAYTPNARVLC